MIVTLCGGHELHPAYGAQCPRNIYSPMRQNEYASTITHRNTSCQLIKVSGAYKDVLQDQFKTKIHVISE